MANVTDELQNGDSVEIQYFLRIPEIHRQASAELHDEAFGAKFSVAIANREKRIAVIASGLNLEFAFCAVRGSQLVGLAGFHTEEGSLTSGITYRSLLSHLGFFKGNWAAVIFSLYERSPKSSELVMDGIAVANHFRGKGVGTGLIKELIRYASVHQYHKIRLDVIDTNDRATSLYKRMGFQCIKTEHFEYLRWLLGFGASTTMEFSVDRPYEAKEL